MKDYIQTRIQRTQELLDKHDYDAVIATSSANFYYYTDQWLDGHERLLALVIPRTGEPVIVAPKLHQEELADAPFEVMLWDDGADTIEFLTKVLPHAGVIGIDASWPSHFLIALTKRLPQCRYESGSEVFGRLRRKKDPHEIQLLQQVGEVTDRVMTKMTKRVRIGMTERDVVTELTNLWREEGVHELSFAPIIASGPNGARPHHQPGSAVIQSGDSVIIDMGGVMNHYCSDITRTIVMEQQTPEIEQVYQIVRASQAAGARAVRPGVKIGDIDRIARDVIVQSGYGEFFNNRVGHGLGLEIHEEPYAYGGNELILEPGMVFSVEPGIYLPGQFGVRIEDVVVVTESGCDSLYQCTKDLLVV